MQIEVTTVRLGYWQSAQKTIRSARIVDHLVEQRSSVFAIDYLRLRIVVDGKTGAAIILDHEIGSVIRVITSRYDRTDALRIGEHVSPYDCFWFTIECKNRRIEQRGHNVSGSVAV